MRNPSPPPRSPGTRTKSAQVPRLISIGDRHKARQHATRIGVWIGRSLLSLGMVISFAIVTQNKMIGLHQIVNFLFLPVVYSGSIAVLFLPGIAIGGTWGRAIAQNLIKKLKRPLEPVNLQERLRAAIATSAIVLLVSSVVATIICYGLLAIGMLAAFIGIDFGIWIIAIVLLLICPGFMPAIVITRLAITKAVQSAFPELGR